MKCYPEKINAFFENEKNESDIKEFVLNLFKIFSSTDKYNSFDSEKSKAIFLLLGFYEVEDEDEIDEDNPVIDFSNLCNIALPFRTYILDLISKGLKEGHYSDFADGLLVKDLKIIIGYKDWKKINRKNKLQILNNL